MITLHCYRRGGVVVGYEFRQGETTVGITDAVREGFTVQPEDAPIVDMMLRAFTEVTDVKMPVGGRG